MPTEDRTYDECSGASPSRLTNDHPREARNGNADSRQRGIHHISWGIYKMLGRVLTRSTTPQAGILNEAMQKE